MNKPVDINIDLTKYILVENKDWKEVEVNGETVKIPKDWIGPVKLTNLFEIKRGKVLSQDYISKNAGAYPVYSSATENEGCIGHISEYAFEGEYLTWTTDGVYAGTVFYRNGKFNCTNICGTLKPISNALNCKALYYFVKTELPKHVNHIGNSKLMSNVVEKLHLIFPPLPEQTAIASVLSTQESIISDISLLISKHEQRLAWLSDQLLSGKLRVKRNVASVADADECIVGDNNSEPVELEQLSFYQNPDNNLKEVEVNGELVNVPETWSVKSFSDLIDWYSTGSAFTSGEMSQSAGKYGIIKMTNIVNGQIGKILTTYTDKYIESALLKAGDVVVGLSGSIGKLGEVVESEKPLLLNQRCFALRFKQEFKWLGRLLIGKIVTNMEREAAGGAIVNLSHLTVLGYQTVVPIQNHELSAIAAVLSAQEGLIADYKKLLEKEKERMIWLSDALLSGKYRLQATEV